MPEIVVEDGTAIATANSYISGDDLETYCDNIATTLASTDSDAIDSACIRASQALDGAYRMAYPGYRTKAREQGLEWPRTAAYDYEGIIINTNVVPAEVIKATCEMAIREITTPGIMQPDLKRGGFIRSLRAGPVEIVYGGTSSVTIFQRIDQIMASLLGAQPAFGLSGTAKRA